MFQSRGCDLWRNEGSGGLGFPGVSKSIPKSWMMCRQSGLFRSARHRGQPSCTYTVVDGRWDFMASIDAWWRIFAELPALALSPWIIALLQKTPFPLPWKTVWPGTGGF
jgi:hypothetical protein